MKLWSAFDGAEEEEDDWGGERIAIVKCVVTCEAQKKKKGMNGSRDESWPSNCDWSRAEGGNL